MKTNSKNSRLLSSLLSYYSRLPERSNSHPVVSEARQKAFDRLRDFGLPGKKDERWRDSALLNVFDREFRLETERQPYRKAINEIFECEISGFHPEIISVLNGHYYAKDPGEIRSLDNGVLVGSILVAQKEFPALFDRYFGKIGDYKTDGLKAANTAFFKDGIFIYVPDGVEVNDALQLIKMVNETGNPFIASRNLILLGKNSKLTFMHCDDSINHFSSFVNTFTEIYVGENATLELYKLQNLNDESALLNNTFIRQEKNSKTHANVISLNGGIIRNELHIDLAGEGAETDLSGVYLMDKEQHIDNQVYVNHLVPHCNSNTLYKGVLDNKATAIFRGYIFVKRDAQKTNAFQKNNNILMTSDARIDTMPFLEIYADDVKCSHGATVGQLDDEALFYLMQRGINRDDATLLLMNAFTSEVTSKISIDPLRITTEDMIKKRLRGELSICDKCILHCSVPDQPVEFEIDLSKI
ncbi:MAG: Fe-S cluster assembly protein SufD [Chlorobi bacterium]|nr:Fe-S cluster assembly protein SufD [Chlorobiota bacterium]